MNNKIGILHLEDSIKDSELIHSMIESGKIEHDYFLVDNEKDFNYILETKKIDLILSDYSLPDYNGNEALKIARENFSDISFIFISGTIGEDNAIDAMLNGATDYVLKNKLERIVPSIKRAIYEQELKMKNRLAEKALRESEKMLRKAQKLAHIGVWSWKKDIDCVTWTKELYHIAGRDPKLPAPTFAEQPALYTPHSWHLLSTAVEKAMETGESYQLELELIRPDGSIRNLNAFGGAKFNNNGQIDGFYGTVQDITKRKRAEEEIIRINKKLAFQIKQKEKRAAELIIANKELAFQNKEKEKRAEELIIAKEKAEESDRLKSAFLANMSHELRTPLNSIIGFSELMIDPDYDYAQQLKFARMINISGNNLLAIIMDIMNISKIEAGQLYINKQLLSVNKLITDIYDEFSFRVNEKGIEFKLDDSNPANEILIVSDITKLRQILVNFIINAIKFTKEGRIEIGFNTVGEFVQFHVIDTGIGISKEFHEQIFERFRQVESALNRRYGGNGLGLAISKSLVELLGGTIWLESEEGKGSTFYFLIPISDKQSIETNELITNRKASLH